MNPRRNLAFERALSRWIGARRCDGCGKQLGNDPRRVSRFRQFHPACAPDAAKSTTLQETGE